MSDEHTGTQTPTAAPAPVEGAIHSENGYAEHMAIATDNPGRAMFVIALCFILSMLATVGLGYTYVRGGQAQIEGMMLFVIFGGIGVGMAAWGKWLMPKGPFVEEREVLTSPESQEKFAQAFRRGEVAIEGRRSVLLKLMLGAMGFMTAVLVFPIRSLTGKGPSKDSGLYTTGWKKGSLLLTDEGKPIHVDDLEVGGLQTVFPENSNNDAIDQTILIRAATEPVYPPSEPRKKWWSPQGYIAFSKICTHAGCPVGQYQAQFQQLMCPCHQSTFDILNGAKVVFGPAPRPLAQLPLMVDADGYLRASSGYGEPVGPGFWSRGGLR